MRVSREYALAIADLPLTGGCMCGGVRFEVTEQALFASYCHCTRCQRRTGTAASASARIVPGSLHITSGEELLRAYEPEGGYPKVFCSACGSALWSRSPVDPDVISVRLGSFDGDPGIRPSFRNYVAYAAPWEPIPDDGLPRFPEQRP
ncbi:MAG TPA: GFA family protein [Gaiellaceae bacterium]